jgi:hypothetical protein
MAAAGDVAAGAADGTAAGSRTGRSAAMAALDSLAASITEYGHFIHTLVRSKPGCGYGHRSPRNDSAAWVA